MVDETPTDGGAGQRRQLENEGVLKRAWSKVSGHGDVFDAKLSQSLDVVRRALDDFGGGGETGNGLAISFNGGKDACVVLYLLLFVLAERGELWRLHSSTTGRQVRRAGQPFDASCFFLHSQAHCCPCVSCVQARILSHGCCGGAPIKHVNLEFLETSATSRPRCDVCTHAEKDESSSGV